MPSHPGPPHLMLSGSTLKFEPQLTVKHRLPGTRSPTVRLPLRQELTHPSLQILRVRDDFDLTPLFEGLQSAESRQHFHLVVCALRFRPCEDAFPCTVL